MGFRYIGNTSELKSDDTKITSLTVTELKELIREVVSEEVAKHRFIAPSPVAPPQPYYYNVEPWGKEYEVTYTTKTTSKNVEERN